MASRLWGALLPQEDGSSRGLYQLIDQLDQLGAEVPASRTDAAPATRSAEWTRQSSGRGATRSNSPREAMAPKMSTSSTLHASEDEEDEEDITDRQRMLRALLDGMRFQTFMALAILLNGIVMGLETDMDQYKKMWDFIEDVFLFIFAAEIILRLQAFGLSRFFAWRNPDFFWNFFDFFVVAIGVLDFLGTHFKASDEEEDMASKMFRLVRLLRVLRILKLVKSLRQLYMLVYGFMEAAKAIGWVTLLMGFVLYGCSVVLVRTLGKLDQTAHTDAFELLHAKFGTIPTAMLTLFTFMSNPDIEVYEPYFAEFPFLCAFLILYSIFGSFGMIALLTGVITESMFEKNQLRMEDMRLEQEWRHKTMSKEFVRMFDAISTEQGGEVRHSHLETLVPSIARLMEKNMIHFTEHDLRNMLSFMDLDGDGKVNKEEFLQGVFQIAEGVRPMSIMEIHYSVLRCRSALKQIQAMNQQMMSHFDLDTELPKPRIDRRTTFQSFPGYSQSTELPRFEAEESPENSKESPAPLASPEPQPTPSSGPSPVRRNTRRATGDVADLRKLLKDPLERLAKDVARLVEGQAEMLRGGRSPSKLDGDDVLGGSSIGGRDGELEAASDCGAADVRRSVARLAALVGEARGLAGDAGGSTKDAASGGAAFTKVFDEGARGDLCRDGALLSAFEDWLRRAEARLPPPLLPKGLSRL